MAIERAAVGLVLRRERRRWILNVVRAGTENHVFHEARCRAGKELDVHKLREEQKFESLEALKEQIARDAGAARGLLGV